MKFYILYFFFLIYGCSSKSKNFEKMICGNKIKYWDMVDSTEKVRWGYSFSKEKTCFYYYYDGLTGCERSRMDDDDLVYEDTWLLINDSTLNFRSADRKILIINEDSLLTEVKGHKLLLLKSDCN